MRWVLRVLPVMLVVAACKSETAPPAKAVEAKAPAALPFQAVVAHSGGRVKGLEYTNSREALDASHAAGFRWFELDLATTTDGKVVLVNNWGDTFETLFGATRGRRSHAEFMALKMTEGLTALDLQGLIAWLSAHPDAVVVTDVKDENGAVLSTIAKEHAAFRDRFIPQIYQLEEYAQIAPLGFGAPILSTYVSDATDDEILAFVKANPVRAVAMTPERAKASDLAKKLGEVNVPVYVHTVNDAAEREALAKLGVDGVYTDDLAPAK